MSGDGRSSWWGGREGRKTRASNMILFTRSANATKLSHQHFQKVLQSLTQLFRRIRLSQWWDVHKQNWTLTQMQGLVKSHKYRPASSDMPNSTPFWADKDSQIPSRSNFVSISSGPFSTHEAVNGRRPSTSRWR